MNLPRFGGAATSGGALDHACVARFADCYVPSCTNCGRLRRMPHGSYRLVIAVIASADNRRAGGAPPADIPVVRRRRGPLEVSTFRSAAG
jgi:hypothetical protein